MRTAKKNENSEEIKRRIREAMTINFGGTMNMVLGYYNGGYLTKEKAIKTFFRYSVMKKEDLKYDELYEEYLQLKKSYYEKLKMFLS